MRQVFLFQIALFLLWLLINGAASAHISSAIWKQHLYACPYMQQAARRDGFSYNFAPYFVLFMSLMLVTIAEAINPAVYSLE